MFQDLICHVKTPVFKSIIFPWEHWLTVRSSAWGFVSSWAFEGIQQCNSSELFLWHVRRNPNWYQCILRNHVFSNLLLNPSDLDSWCFYRKKNRGISISTAWFFSKLHQDISHLCLWFFCSNVSSSEWIVSNWVFAILHWNTSELHRQIHQTEDRSDIKPFFQLVPLNIQSLFCGHSSLFSSSL